MMRHSVNKNRRMGLGGTPKIFRYTGKNLPVASLLQSAFSVSISGQH